MTIQWNDELRTGIDKVDSQHKELFNRINKLISACNVGKGRNEALTTFTFLEDYIITHFESEESIMHKYNYINYLSHFAQHEQFISVVKELKRDLEQNGATGPFVMQINKKIGQWLVSHITKEDKALAKFIRERA